MPINPGDDPEFTELYDELVASWAQLEAEKDGFELAADFARAAWACGHSFAVAQYAPA